MAKGFNSRGMGGFGGGNDFLFCCIRAAVSNIFTHGSFLQPGFLQNHAVAAAQ